ncbi:MAG: hypothetical protein WBX10_14445, partial [Candidatus Sulfotelmatobacter sp.]
RAGSWLPAMLEPEMKRHQLGFELTAVAERKASFRVDAAGPVFGPHYFEAYSPVKLKITHRGQNN